MGGGAEAAEAAKPIGLPNFIVHQFIRPNVTLTSVLVFSFSSGAATSCKLRRKEGSLRPSGRLVRRSAPRQCLLLKAGRVEGRDTAAAAMQLPPPTAVAKFRRSQSRKAGYQEESAVTRWRSCARVNLLWMLKSRKGKSRSDHGHRSTESRTSAAQLPSNRGRSQWSMRRECRDAAAHSALNNLLLAKSRKGQSKPTAPPTLHRSTAWQSLLKCLVISNTGNSRLAVEAEDDALLMCCRLQAFNGGHGLG